MAQVNSKHRAAWRVDFRNKENLPDIKLIRTSFVINYGSFILMLCCATLFINQQVKLSSYARKIEDVQAESKSLKPSHQDALSRSSEFRKFAKEMADFRKFYRGDLAFHEFFELLSIECPENLAFTEMGYILHSGGEDQPDKLEPKIRMLGVVRGDPRDALSLLDTYQALMSQMSMIANNATLIEFIPGDFDSQKNQTAFEILITLVAV